MSRTREGRMSLYTLLHNKTPSPCLPLHRPVGPNRREIGLQRDDVLFGAGDGTRTRDSLLGRQVVTKSPTASREMALGEHSYIFTVIHAHLRQIVACILRQMVMDQMYWKEYTRQPFERQERQMVNHPGTQLSPSLMFSDMSWKSFLWQSEHHQSNKTG